MDRKDKDRRDTSRRDGDSRTTDKRSYEKRTDKSRSRSRDRKRDRNGRRTSRSRSPDRKRDRGDKDDDKGRTDRKKSHRHDSDRDRDNDRDHNPKKSSHDSRSKDTKKKEDKVDEVEDYDDSTLKEFEDFITEENVDEVREAERLALERKLRREAILQKYNAEKSVSAPTSVELSMNSAIKNAYIAKQNDADRLSAITGAAGLAVVAGGNGVTGENDVVAVGANIVNSDISAVSMSASASLAALAIAESNGHGNDRNNGDKGDIGVTDVTAVTTKISKAIGDDEGDILDTRESLGEGTEESTAELLGIARVAVSTLESHITTHADNGITTDVPYSRDNSDNRDNRDNRVSGDRIEDYHNTPESRFTNSNDERLAEKNALKQDAHNHKESQPFDMFSSSPSDVERGVKGNAGPWAGKRALREALLEGEDPHLQSNWDDGEGYYKPRIGELIGDQYQTMGIVGKGVFSVVIKCIDLKVRDGDPVAIKVIRNNDTMRKAADKESGDLKVVKLCDFGSAFRETDTDNDPTPYLVSRFYRAPEIILGLPYDRAIDLWSVAVCLYELFTGHVMFPGRSNNEMLRLMMAIKGRIANKQLKSHFRAYEAMSLDAHFDERDLKFKQQELDPVTGKQVQRLVDVTQPSKDLASVIRSSKAGSDDGRLVSSLADLLDKCLALDPLKRISVMDALKHPFFTLH